MTAQISDCCQFQGQDYCIAGISEGTLFTPESLGMKPAGTCSACWRGYCISYGVLEDTLVVADLHVNLLSEWRGKVMKGPKINGKAPTLPEDEHDWFNNHYLGVNLKLDYSGGLLLATDFIDRYYVHMGFHPAWKYKVVIELVFEEGVLVKHQDLSARMAEFRKDIDEARESGPADMPDRDTIKAFIERSFDRTYER